MTMIDGYKLSKLLDTVENFTIGSYNIPIWFRALKTYTLTHMSMVIKDDLNGKCKVIPMFSKCIS